MIQVSDTLAQNFLVNKKYLESIKIEDGKIFHLEWHQKRMDVVFQELLKKEPYQLEHLFSRVPHDGLWRCRVVYNADSIKLEYLPYKKRKIEHLKLIYNNEIAYRYKYAKREKLEKLFALREQAEDILIVQNSYLTDTSIANIALFDGEQWFTPKKPLLYGTTRARLLDEGKIYEQNIKVEDVKHFKKLALMNAMIDFDIIAEENIEDVLC